MGPQSRADAETDAPEINDPRVVPRAWQLADTPPLGGRIKERPDDFFVEEIPAYETTGAGEHIYLMVEKRDLSTFQAISILAGHFDVDPRDIGYAGLKDRFAITRQLLSVHAPGRKLAEFPSLRHDRLTVLWADHHENKLRRGHLRGNRFAIKVRGVEIGKAPLVHRSLLSLATTGVANRFGEQRFGYTLRNHLIGRALIRGDHQGALNAMLGPSNHPHDLQAPARQAFAAGDLRDALHRFSQNSKTERAVLRRLIRGATPEQAVAAIGRPEKEFFLTAFQSAVFNAMLDERVRSGALASLSPGDVAVKHDNHALFDIDPATAADPETARRLAAFEISPSGPMWGSAMKRAAGATDAAEVAALAVHGLAPESLADFEKRRPGMIEGTRRSVRVPVTNPGVEAGVDDHGPYIACSFELPRGSFATAVLREIFKPELAGAPLHTTAPLEPEER